MTFKKTILLLLLFTAPAFVRAQCSMCRAVLESSGNQEQAEALNHGIMYLMAFPYILMGGLGAFAWWYLRKNKKEEVS